jgi:hypothetical protein
MFQKSSCSNCQLLFPYLWEAFERLFNSHFEKLAKKCSEHWTFFFVSNLKYIALIELNALNLNVQSDPVIRIFISYEFMQPWFKIILLEFRCFRPKKKYLLSTIMYSCTVLYAKLTITLRLFAIPISLTELFPEFFLVLNIKDCIKIFKDMLHNNLRVLENNSPKYFRIVFLDFIHKTAMENFSKQF